VTDHGRKYGDRQSHPIPVWNGIFEHYGRIRDALWEFEWCIDRITEEQKGIGLVLGGAPVKISTIVADLKGSQKETVRRHLEHLEGEKYIRRRRTAYGHVIEVLNSRKFGIWRKEKPQNDASLSQEKPICGSQKPTGGSQKPKIDTNKEDSAVTQQDTAVAGRPDVWEFLGVDHSGLTPSISELCRNFYRSKNGQTPVEFIGECMDGIEALRERIPAAIAARAKTLRSQAGTMVKATMPELEAEPWAK